jgi:hypothetical protein
MNKLELIQALNDTDLTKSEAAAVVDIFFNGMASELAKGGGRVQEKRKLEKFIAVNTPKSGAYPEGNPL